MKQKNKNAYKFDNRKCVDSEKLVPHIRLEWLYTYALEYCFEFLNGANKCPHIIFAYHGSGNCLKEKKKIVKFFFRLLHSPTLESTHFYLKNTL